MAAQKGNALLVKKSNGDSPETFTTLAGVRTKTVTLGGDPIDTTTDDDILAGVSWRTYISGIVDFEASVDGVAKDYTAMKALIDASLNGTVTNYQILITNIGTLEGPMILTNFQFNAQHTDTLQFSVNIRANSALTFTPASP